MEPAKADREYPLGEIIIKTGKESQEDMADTRTDELYRALHDKGYPDELCQCNAPDAGTRFKLYK